MPSQGKAKKGRRRKLKFLPLVAAKLQVPAAEIIVHLVVSMLSVMSIELIELLLRSLGLDGKKIPGTGIVFSDWILILDIVAATAIIIVGIGKAVWAIGKDHE